MVNNRPNIQTVRRCSVNVMLLWVSQQRQQRTFLIFHFGRNGLGRLRLRRLAPHSTIDNQLPWSDLKRLQRARVLPATSMAIDKGTMPVTSPFSKRCYCLLLTSAPFFLTLWHCCLCQYLALNNQAKHTASIIYNDFFITDTFKHWLTTSRPIINKNIRPHSLNEHEAYVYVVILNFMTPNHFYQTANIYRSTWPQ